MFGDIEVVRNSLPITYLNSINFINVENLKILDENKMDFIVYSDNTKSEKTNKIIYFDVPTNFNYECCKYKFISVIIIFSDNEQYNLKLYSGNENYYIVNNRLNKNVFCYLIMKQYGIVKNENNVTYKLNIIDYDIKFKYFDEKDEILLNCYNYSVIRNIDLIIEEEKEEEDASAQSKNIESDEELLFKGNDYIVE
jgi:hypothetical protein